MPLSIREIETTKHDPKKITWLNDGDGLWLCIFKNGTKAWRALPVEEEASHALLGYFPKDHSQGGKR